MTAESDAEAVHNPYLREEIRDLLGGAPDQPDIEFETGRIMEVATVEGVLDTALARRLAEGRAKGQLLSQITGRAHFMGLHLVMEPGVFVAREETELLGRTAVGWLQDWAGASQEPDRCLHVVDIGSGSGNLTCGIATALPTARLWAIDIDPACCALTGRNVEKCGLQERVEVLAGDLFAPLAGRGLEGQVDAVVCNPPYIASVRLQKDRAYLLENEPRAAFDGGPFGITMLMRLLKESLPFLRPGGRLFFEFGAGQGQQVSQLISRVGGYEDADLISDDQGTARVLMARKA